MVLSGGRRRPARLRGPRTRALGLILAVVVLLPGIPSMFRAGSAAPSTLVGVAFRSQGGGWKLGRDGVVVPFGGARYYGSPSGRRQAFAAIAATGDGGGYWVVARNGHVSAFGDARSYGSMRAHGRHAPAVVGMAALPDGRGYWLLDATGRVVALGSARWYGSPFRRRIPARATAIAATPDGHGYWTLSSRGNVLPFGDARWAGSPAASRETGHYVGLTAAPTGFGYWIGSASGYVRAYGAARRATSPVSRAASSAVSLSTAGHVYGLLTRAGSVVVWRGAAARRATTSPTTAPPVTGPPTSVGAPTTGVSSSPSTTPPPTTVPPTTVPPTTAPPTTVPPTTVPPTTVPPPPTTTLPPTTPSPSSPVPVPSLPGGPTHLIFDDEFNGTHLSSVWNTCWWYSPSPSGCSNGDGEGEWYTPHNVTVANGQLDLTAEHQPTEGVWMSSGQPRLYDYTSGMVDTRGGFSFKYGYVEWRAWLPSGQGLWPALWMMPANDTWPPEIDALETIGSQPTVWTGTYHPPSPQPAQGFDATVPDLSSGWHTFGVDWEPGRITWYVDGTQMATTTDNVTSDPMYLVMDLAVGGAWPGSPNGSTPFPATLRIAYVRVWQH